MTSMNKAVVYAEDMEDSMMNEAIEVAKAAFDDPKTTTSSKVFTVVANIIRSTFDKRHDRHWNCVVGRNFGSYVTHKTKTYIYFSGNTTFLQMTLEIGL